MSRKLKVAIIGLGNIGTAIAANLVKSNREVIVAGRKIEDGQALALRLGSYAKPADVRSAILEAGVIVMSVWFNTIQELLKEYRYELKGKIIIDPSNPIAADGSGGFKKIIPVTQSAGKILSDLMPERATLVKALGSLGVASLAGQAFQNPTKVFFYATDHSNVHDIVEELITDNGFEPLNIGGIDESIKMEVFGELHEFGALGKAVTKSELLEKA